MSYQNDARSGKKVQVLLKMSYQPWTSECVTPTSIELDGVFEEAHRCTGGSSRNAFPRLTRYTF